MHLLQQGAGKACSLPSGDAVVGYVFQMGLVLQSAFCNCDTVLGLSSDAFAVLCCSVATHGLLEQADLASEPCVNLCTDVTVASGCEATVQAWEDQNHICSCSVFPS